MFKMVLSECLKLKTYRDEEARKRKDQGHWQSGVKAHLVQPRIANVPRKIGQNHGCKEKGGGTTVEKKRKTCLRREVD